jgi:hypothetical protein
MKGLLAVVIALAGVLPASAAPGCLSRSYSLDLDIDGNPSELVTIENDKMRLQAAGYNPLWVELYGGCLRVTYRDEGSLVVEYLDAESLEPVY